MMILTEISKLMAWLILILYQKGWRNFERETILGKFEWLRSWMVLPRALKDGGKRILQYVLETFSNPNGYIHHINLLYLVGINWKLPYSDCKEFIWHYILEIFLTQQDSTSSLMPGGNFILRLCLHTRNKKILQGKMAGGLSGSGKP